MGSNSATLRIALAIAVVGVLDAHNVHAQDPELLDHFWMTQGYVWSMDVDDAEEILYVGGSFSAFYAYTPYGSVMEMEGQPWPDQDQERPNSFLDAVISDGNGGWYIGGNFTQIGDHTQARIAHIGPQGQLLPWNVTCDGSVLSLALSDGILYVGGQFTSLCGQPRANLGAVDLSTGEATTWNPGTDQAVAGIEVGGNTVHVVGNFNTIGGQPRVRIAAVDRTTGLATGFNANVDIFPNVIELVGDTLFVGGNFTQIGGQDRANIAALDPSTGAALSWDPGADQPVSDLLVVGDLLYVGGGFSSIAATPRSRLASFDLISGELTSWSPEVSDDVSRMEWANDQVYITGDFTSIAGQPRIRMASVDPITGAPTDFMCHLMTSGGTDIPCASGTMLYIGGRHIGAGSRLRRNLVAIDIATGRPTEWNPKADDQVMAIEASGSSVYIGGYFTEVNDVARGRLAEVSTTGSLLPWDPNISGEVLELAVDDTLVHIGGAFAAAGGLPRAGFATISRTSGDPTSYILPGYSPDADALLPAEGDLFIGGTNVLQNYYIQRIDPSTTVVEWSQSDVGSINDVALIDNTLFVASSTGPRTLHAGTGEVLPWWPTDGPVRYIEHLGGTVWFGGSFSFLNGAPHGRLAFADAITGELNDWDAMLGSNVNAMDHAESKVFAGGIFTTVAGQPRRSLVAFETASIPTGMDLPRRGYDASVLISPNPSTSRSFRIQITGDRPATMRIVNSLGGIVFQGAFQEQLDLHDVPTGVYVIQLFDQDLRSSGSARWIHE
ncbi:MAG: PQQ-binding-like beta-propeller repeat protein [Flavobacteriales bacterium]|nr:PQQ-binding-like beta-propeller repeat protein [Flavobacteriales bacterium]